MSTTTTTTVEVEDRYDEETETVYEVDVEWTFSDYDPGVFSGPVERCYPPEGGETTNCVVILPDGTRVEDGESWLRKEVGDNGFDCAEDEAFAEAGNDY